MSDTADSTSRIKIEDGWKEVLKDEFVKPYFQYLKAFLVQEKQAGKVIYPPGPLIFNAFNSTPFHAVKVVIIGQDPYHGPGQAHGLCFSVQHGVAIPPSLKNIYQELKTDVGITLPAHGNLEAWTAQGVLLLNALLTVQAGQPGSHRGKGWEQFTDAAIRAVNDHKQGIVFLLWGKYAQEKGQVIDPQKHMVLKAAHPSPFSAHSGFFGCGHFSRTNEILQQQGKAPIDWQV
jgi:uracil-DNA glycosylase